MYPTSLLVHTCQVESGETVGTADAWNIGAPTKTYTDVKCRFVMPKLNMQRGEAGYLPVRGLSIILPVGTSVTEGKTIVGLSTGFLKTYRIIGGPREALVRSQVSHIVADLEVIG